jgi:hypothetical protein
MVIFCTSLKKELYRVKCANCYEEDCFDSLAYYNFVNSLKGRGGSLAKGEMYPIAIRMNKEKR